jgi:hypothetical protein
VLISSISGSGDYTTIISKKYLFLELKHNRSSKIVIVCGFELSDKENQHELNSDTPILPFLDPSGNSESFCDGL